jgi:hypothetical protein
MNSKKNKNEFSKRQIIIITVITTLILIFVLGNMIRLPYIGMVTYTKTVPSTELGEYNVQETYKEEICHEENITYNVEWGNIRKECLNKKCIDKIRFCTSTNKYGICDGYQERCNVYKCTFYQLDCRLNLYNLDDKEALFKIEGFVINQNNAKIPLNNITINISSKESKSLSWSFNHSENDPHNCWYDNLVVSNKTICEEAKKSRIVTKRQNISVEKEVITQEPTIRYRTILQTLIK